MIQNLILQLDINPLLPADIIKVFFLFQIFWKKILKPTKTIDKDHLFCNTGLPKTPHSFYEPQLS